MLMGKSREDFRFMNEFEKTCERLKVKISVGKSEVLVIRKDQRRNIEKVKVNGKRMEEGKNLNI